MRQKLLQIGAGLLQIGKPITNPGRILQIGAKNASIVVGSFLLKLKTITMDFEINVVCNILKDNVHEQVYS